MNKKIVITQADYKAYEKGRIELLQRKIEERDSLCEKVVTIILTFIISTGIIAIFYQGVKMIVSWFH